MTLLPSLKLKVEEIPYCLIGGELDELLAAVKRLPDRAWGEYTGRGNCWFLGGTIADVRAALSPLQVLEPGDELKESLLKIIQDARDLITSRESQVQKESRRLFALAAIYSEKSKSPCKADALRDGYCLLNAIEANRKPISALNDSEALALVRGARLINTNDIGKPPDSNRMLSDALILNHEKISSTIDRCLTNNSEDFRVEVKAILAMGSRFTWKRELIPTIRQESNAMITFAVRYSKSFGDHHGDNVPMGNSVVKEIMIDSCERLEQWLIMKEALSERFPEMYFYIIHACLAMMAGEWEGSQV